MIRQFGAAAMVVFLLAGGSWAQEPPRTDPWPTGLRGFKGTLLVKYEGRKGTIFVVRVMDVLEVAKDNKARHPPEADGKLLPVGLMKGTKLDEELVRKVEGFQRGQELELEAVHLSGTRLDVEGYFGPPRQKKEEKIATAGSSSFFGVKIEGDGATDPKVIAALQKRADEAAANAKEGRLEEALAQLEKLRTDAPKTVKTAGLQEAIAHLKQKIVESKKDLETAGDLNARIARAIDLENAGKFAKARDLFRRIHKDLPEGTQAPGLAEALARVEGKAELAEKLAAAETLENSGKLDEAAAAVEAVAREAAQKNFTLPRIDAARRRIDQKKKFGPLLEKLNQGMQQANALAGEGKLDEAIALLQKLRTEIPAGSPIDPAPIDAAIEQFEKVRRDAK